MEQVRLLLAIVLSFLVFVVWQWLFVEPEMAQQAQQAQEQASSAESQDTQEATAAKEDKSEEATPATIAEQAPLPTDSGREPRTIKVETPLFTATLSEKGGTVESLILAQYRESSAPDSPLKAMVNERARLINLASGWAGNAVAGMEQAVYELKSRDDIVKVSDQTAAIEFQWVSNDGISVTKQFSFSADSYLIDLKVIVANHSGAAINDQPTVSIAQVIGDPESRITFEGPMALVGDQLEEIKVKDIAEKPEVSGSFRWAALTDRYFMTVLIPDEVANATMKMKTVGEDMVISKLVFPETTIAPGNVETFAYKAFIGPKDTETLKKANYQLDEAVNFGMFDFLAKPFLWIMNQIYEVLPNYGIAIIILTLITKVILWPLGNKSYKSMNDMKRMQPLMAEIREKYKNDKKKINEETMALYRTYKINPMGGCLPMVVQLPVFFALYRMLYQAIELRHAPFFGWINDLSAPDRLFEFGFSIPFMEPPFGIPVLTIVMGATMFLQQKMSPPPGDPTQAKMMMFMPIIFTFIFINFSSGLVLYWLINNIFSIAQQYYIQKKFA